jgi:glycosyltransferase involved in cell wall biosynthesis
MRIIDMEGIRNVEFLGEVSGKTLQSCFEESSLFVLMSQEEGLSFEGFGLVFLEAGAYGLPVVGTRTGGIPDAVHDGETGILVAPDDVTGAARAMETLLRTPALARTMGLAGRAYAESLTWERYSEQMMQVYLRAVDKGPRQQGFGP